MSKSACLPIVQMKTPGSARQAAVSWVSQSSLLFLTLTSWLLILQCGVVVRSTGKLRLCSFPRVLTSYVQVWRSSAQREGGGRVRGRWWARAFLRPRGQVIASYTPSYTRKWNLSITGPQPARTGGLPENRIFMNFGKRKLRSASYR